MCGSYFLVSREQLQDIRDMLAEIEERLGKQMGDMFPKSLAPVLGQGEEGIKPVIMRWGFPSPAGKSAVVFNARSEDIETKPMFSRAIRTRRCVVPASGFYEFSGVKGSKIRHIFTLPSESTLYLAACYSSYPAQEGDNLSENRFVILTTGANMYVEQIHHRMPVVLLPEELELWLRGDYKKLLDRSHLELSHRVA
jgi:putative SOS response-associated peptidase YedK